MSKLFGIINALEINDHHTSHDEYRNWCDLAGEEPYPSGRFQYSLTERDQRWVILDAMQRQIEEDPEAETVSSEYILGALADSPFPPSLEQHFEALCEMVLVLHQRQPTPLPI